MIRRALALALAWSVGACGQDSSPKDTPVKATPAKSDTVVERFLVASGPDAATMMDWRHIPNANALAVMQIASDLPEQLDSMLEAYKSAVVEEQARALESQFIATWSPKSKCTVKPLPKSELSALAPSLVAKLPEGLADTAKQLASASYFTADCGDAQLEIAVNAEDRIIALRDQAPVDPEGESRFREYLQDP